LIEVGDLCIGDSAGESLQRLQIKVWNPGCRLSGEEVGKVRAASALPLNQRDHPEGGKIRHCEEKD